LSSLATQAASQESDEFMQQGVEVPSMRAIISALSQAARLMAVVVGMQVPLGQRVLVVRALYDSCDESIQPIFLEFVALFKLRSCNVVDKVPARAPSGNGIAATPCPARNVVCLAALDQTLDQCAFLLQAVERYLRLVSSHMMVGENGAESALAGSLPAMAQGLMGEFVQAEHAFVAAQILAALQLSQCVVLSEDVFVDSWVDSVYFILRQSVSRCASTYSTMTAAAALNHVVALIEDQVQPVFKQAMHQAQALDPEAFGCDETQALIQDADSKTQVFDALADQLHEPTIDHRSISCQAIQCLNTASLVVDFSAQFSDMIAAELQGIFSTTPTKPGAEQAAPLDSVLSFGIQQLADITQAFQKLWRTGLDLLVERKFQAGIAEWLHNIRSADFIVPLEQFDTISASHTLFELFKLHVCTRSGLQTVTRACTDSAASYLGQRVSSNVSSELEVVLLEVKCNELGGMYLNRLLRDVRQHLELVARSTSLKGEFARAVQLAALLSSASPSDAAQLHFTAAKLRPPEVRKALHNRVDYLAPDVEAIKLGAMNIIHERSATLD
jgi:hypothetical protein